MNLKNLLSKVATAAALTAAAAAANADTYNYSLTGSYTATWQLDSTYIPDAFEVGNVFLYVDVAGFNDAALGVADVYFWHADSGGGLMIDDYWGGSTLLIADGPQLYTGSEDSPTLKLGTFAMTEFGGSGTYTLTVTNISAVPEPASIALMLGGLGLVGAAAARRRKAEEVEA